MSITGLTGVFGFHRQVGVGQKVRGPYNAGVGTAAKIDTKQGLKVVGGTGANSGAHSFRLMYRGNITAAIAYGASAATLESALVAAGVPDANITVTSNTSNEYVISFAGDGLELDSQPVGIEIYDWKLPADGSITLISSGTATINGTSQSFYTGGEWNWLPATQVNFQPNQIVQSIPMEVGGDLWARGSYKGGVSGQGQVMFIPRGGLGLAELFYAFTGSTPVAGSQSAYTAKTAHKVIGASSGTNNRLGTIQYRFLPQSGTKAELPWYTLIRNVGGKFVEEFADARLGNFAFDVAASNLLTVDASFVSKNCGTIPVSFGSSTVGERVGDQKAGNGIPFQSVDAVVKLDTSTGTGPGPVAQKSNFNPTRLNIAFANELSSNEFVVGSYYLQDITNLSRTANITYSVYLTDPDLYARTYSYGADVANTEAAWSSKIWKGALELTMTGGQIAYDNNGTATNVVDGSGNPVLYTIKVTIPEMDYMATPISLAGNNLVEYQLTTNVVLSQKADETTPANRVWPFEIEYLTTLDENIV